MKLTPWRTTAGRKDNWGYVHTNDSFSCQHEKLSGKAIPYGMNSNNPCLHTLYPVSSWKTIHDDQKKTLGDRTFSNSSAKIWNSLPQSLKSQQNLISTPLRHCFKLTILEKRLIYNFFLVFHIVYIFAFYCKFKIVTGNIVISNSILICKAHLIISSCMLICAI